MNEVAPLTGECGKSQEVKELARELAANYTSYVDYQKKKLGLSTEEAVAKAEAPWPEEHEQNILTGPADQVHWFDLEALQRKGPELALQCWDGVKREALDEVRSGHRAARAVEGYGAEPWQRAQFLAIRQDLTEAWQPRGGVERQLVDAMAQAQTAVFYWQERLTLRASVEALKEKRAIEERGGWDPPKVTEHQAVEQAAAMVDRFNRIFLRTLRALPDLRRYNPTVIVQSAGQVNVGGQQVNVAGAHWRRAAPCSNDTLSSG